MIYPFAVKCTFREITTFTYSRFLTWLGEVVEGKELLMTFDDMILFENHSVCLEMFHVFS